MVEPSSTGCTNVNRGGKSGTQLAVQALVGVVVERFIGGIVQNVLAKWAHGTRGVGNWKLMLVFPSRANGAGCGSTGEFFSFFAVTALTGGVGVKGGGSGVVEEKSSGWALYAKGGSIVVLMLCFARGANAAVGGALGGLGAFDTEEALVEVIVLGEGGGVVQQVASSGAVGAGRGGAWLIGVRSDGASGA